MASMKSRWVVLAGVLAAAAGVFLLRQKPQTQDPDTAPVAPGGMVDTVEADGGKAFVALPPFLPHSRPAAELGGLVFSDRRFARTPPRVCAACHSLTEGGSDGKVRKGVLTQPLANVAFSRVFLHDGSATDLARVVRLMLESHDFSSVGSLDAWAARLRTDAELAGRFAAVYPDGLTSTNIVAAFIQFVQTQPMITSGTAFDLYCGGNTNALSSTQTAGLGLFRANCLSCHDGATFGARQVVKGLKVPALRGVSRRRRYFSDGSCTNLAEAVSRMAKSSLEPSAREALIDLLGTF